VAEMQYMYSVVPPVYVNTYYCLREKLDWNTKC